MSEKLIYIKGNASGYFKPKVWNASGVFSFYNIDFKTIDIKNSEIIVPFVFNELKVDLYNQPINSSQTVKVFIDETNYIQEDIQEILFTELKIGESISINNESFIKYNSLVYFKIKKIIPAGPVGGTQLAKGNTFTTPVLNTSNNYYLENQTSQVPSAKIVLPKKRTFFEKYLPITDTLTNVKKVPTPITQPTTVPVEQTASSVFRNTILGAFIFSLLVFLFLKMLFGLSFITILLPILFFLMMLMGALKNRFPLFSNSLVVQNRFWNFIGWLLLILGCYLFYKSYPLNTSLLLISLGLSLLLAVRNHSFLKWIGRIGVMITCFFLFGLLKPLIKTGDSETRKTSDETNTDNESENNKWEYTPEVIKDTINTDKNDTLVVSYLSHKLKWNDNYQNQYKGEFKVRKDYFNITKIERNQIEPTGQGFREQFHQIYKQMINQSKNYLDSVIKVYANIGKTNKLNNKMFADMIVTSIQNIPYCLVHDLTHSQADRQYGGFITEYHQSGGPCLAETKFGIQAPVEFIANLKGDCDTRSVFLYYILSKLGYSVVVLGSEHYSHAILGISGNYSGDYINYNGLNYYVWETTATGFTPGNISPKTNNMRYWNVILANKR